VAAGPHARQNTIISFPIPGSRRGALYGLSAAGIVLPLQVQDGTAWAVVPSLKAGDKTTYRLVELPDSPSDGVTVERGEEDVRLESGGRLVLQYVGGMGALPSTAVKPAFRRGGYLHPVRTPAGRIVTADYPPDHRHHHGVWFAWTRTAYQGREPDFWNMGDGKGRVEFEALDATWTGGVHGGLKARHRYVDLTSGTPVTVLREEWLTRVFHAPSGARHFLFDVEVRQTNVTDAPLLLPEYHYGGLAVRGAPDFVPPDHVSFLTSEGRDRTTGDGAPSRWAAMSGDIGGARAGIAILAHPTNFRAPEPMRIHPTDPYMCYAPSRAGAWQIPAGGVHAARYRLVAFDGTPALAELARLWRDYAEPPAVTVR
jgi:hypothetical protein